MAAKKKADPKKKTSKMEDFAQIVDKVFKDQVGRVEIDSNVRKKPHPHIPTGSIIVDWLIGGQPNDIGVPPCPGLPRGRLFNLYGMESSGKTTLALTTAATTIANGGRVCFIDWEHAIDLRYAEAIGVPMDDKKFYLAQPTTLETGMGICYVMARGGIDLIIIDSVGAGVPKVIMDQKTEEIGEIGRIGIASQKWGVFLPKLKEAIAKSGTAVIGISQLRDVISTGKGGYGGPQKQTQGGNAWKFYSELRMMLRRVKSEKGKVYSALENKLVEVVIGNVIKAKIDKCKVAPTQGMEAEFFIRFGEGIDDIQAIIDIASAHGIIHKTGSWMTWEREGEEKALRVQGVAKFREEMLKDPKAWETLYRATLERMSSTGEVGIIEDDEDEDEINLDEVSFLTDDDEDDNK